MSRYNPDFVDRHVRMERKLRRLPRGSGGGSSIGPWVDLMDYLDTAIWDGLGAGFGPHIRLANGRAELCGGIAAIDNATVALLSTNLPPEYHPVGEQTVDIFLPYDDDADSVDLIPARGGWSVNVGGTLAAGGAAGALTFDAAQVIWDMTGVNPVAKYPSGAPHNFGWPLFQTQLTLEGVSWRVSE